VSFMKPCARSGCSKLVKGDFCDEHRRSMRAPTVSHGSADYDGRWQRIRAAHRKRHPLCFLCDRRGITRAMRDVDHVVPFRGDAGLMLAGWNLQSLCKSCHARKTSADRKWAELRYPMPSGEGNRLTVVTGAPGVGKTTWAKARFDVVLDLDDILQELNVPRTLDGIAAAMTVRNQRVRRLRHGAMIVTAPRKAARMFWSEVWGFDVVRLTQQDDKWREQIEGDRFQGARRDRDEAVRSYLQMFEDDDEGSGVQVVAVG
jgi:5-methylcytosine-specific restriction protein A